MKQMAWLPKIAMNYCSGYQDPVIAKQLAGDADFFMGSTAYSPQFAVLMPAVGDVEKISSPKAMVFRSMVIAYQEAVAMLRLAQAIQKAGALDPEKVAETLHQNTWDSPLSLGGKVAFAKGRPET